MTGGTKGWIAVGVLVALLLGAGAALSQSEPARIRFLAWRAGSSDPGVRRRAVSDLLAIERPAIDPVLADVFAREVRERSQTDTRLAIVHRDSLDDGGPSGPDRSLTVPYHDDGVGIISVFMTPDPVALAFERLGGGKRVVLLAKYPRQDAFGAVWWNVVVSCPLDDGTEDRLLKLLPELKK
jgi:hypothetical protein